MIVKIKKTEEITEQEENLGYTWPAKYQNGLENYNKYDQVALVNKNNGRAMEREKEQQQQNPYIVPFILFPFIHGD